MNIKKNKVQILTQGFVIAMEVTQMEAQNSGHIIGVKPLEAPGMDRKNICKGSTCGLSEHGTGSKDAKERSASMRKLLIAVFLCVIFMSVEVVGGIKANSLAILTDAAHLLSDVAAFAISLFSIWASGWEATPRQSYGFYRIEILGALVSIQLIWLLTGILVYEAIVRLIYDNGEVKGVLMFAVSAFGLVVNVVMAVLLGHDHGHSSHSHSHGHDHSESESDHDYDQDYHHHGHRHSHSNTVSVSADHRISVEIKHKDDHQHVVVPEHQHIPLLDHSEEASCEDHCTKGPLKKTRNINIHSAYLHVLGDSIQSIGVMIGGAIIWRKPEWKVIDLICTLLFSVIVLFTTIKMLRDVLDVLMESTPREIDATKLEQGLCEMDGVVAIHELHIWALTLGKVLLACHVTVTPEADADLLLNKVIEYIKREYNISHVTIQIERL